MTIDATPDPHFPTARWMVALLIGSVSVIVLCCTTLFQKSNTILDVYGSNWDRSKEDFQGISDKFGNLFPSDPAFNLPLDPNKRIIILLTSFRSGSTFLGNLFDNNPTIQYVFEPFHDQLMTVLQKQKFIIGARPDHTESDLRMLYLQQMLHNCTVTVNRIVAEKYRWCGLPKENLHRFNTTECNKEIQKRNPEVYQQEICRYRNTTVIKVIRMRHLSELQKISNIKSANIQIIHLLRHPVPCMMSRRTGRIFFMWQDRTKIEPEPHDLSKRRIKMAWEAFNYCYDNLKSIEFVKTHATWLKDRYLKVTFKEMSLKPLETAEKVYSFINETLTDKMIEYIASITEGQSDRHLKNKNQALNVYKNSTEIESKWKKLISASVKLWDVFSFEAQCKLLFEHLDSVFSVDSISLNKLLSIDLAIDNLQGSE